MTDPGWGTGGSDGCTRVHRERASGAFCGPRRGTALARVLACRLHARPIPKGKPDPDVFFSAERTYLAWVRTGVALMGFGFVLARFSLLVHQLRSMGSNPLPDDASDLSRYFGIALVMVGVLTLVAATSATSAPSAG